MTGGVEVVHDLPGSLRVGDVFSMDSVLALCVNAFMECCLWVSHYSNREGREWGVGALSTRGRAVWKS